MMTPLQKKAHGWGRPTPPAQRGYDHVHRRIRRDLFREEPNCRECAKLGVMTKATCADHVIPKCQGGATIRDNYQPLCLTHSRSKTGREGHQMRMAKKRARAALEGKLNANG